MPPEIDTLHQSDSPRRVPKILPLSLMEKIILIRIRMKWSTDKAGEEWGIPGPTLRGWENGNRKPGVAAITKLEKIVKNYETGRLL